MLPFATIAVLLFQHTAYATMSDEQFKLYKQGVNAYDIEVDGSASCGDGSETVSNFLPDTVPAAYKNLFEQAAAASDISPNYLAAIFITEHGNRWPDPNGPWASSPVGASGPFQFMPATWDAYRVDADRNGTPDVQNLTDSAYAAAALLKANGTTNGTRIGTLEKPYARPPVTFLYVAGSYNAGGGRMQESTTPESNVSGNGLPQETITYVKNIYHLVNSGLQKGVPGYGSVDGAVSNAVQEGSTGTASENVNPCTGFPSSGDAAAVAQKAMELAWPTPGHGKEKSSATEAYQNTMPRVQSGDPGNDAWSDCGVFVATVMRSSGADKDYPLRSTSVQLPYLESHTEKYTVYPNFDSVPGGLKPGDILIIGSTHTYIFTGTWQNSNYNSASGSHHDHVPEAGVAYPSQGGQPFKVARLK